MYVCVHIYIYMYKHLGCRWAAALDAAAADPEVGNWKTSGSDNIECSLKARRNLKNIQKTSCQVACVYLRGFVLP